MKLIDKAALVAEIEDWRDKIKKGIFSIPLTGRDKADATFEYEILGKVRDFLDTFEVEEIETPEIPKHSYFEQIYHCGSEPRWKIGDVLAVYDFYSDHEGEHIYGKITDIKMDENEDWCYTFDNGEVLYENMLISDEAYKKN